MICMFAYFNVIILFFFGKGGEGEEKRREIVVLSVAASIYAYAFLPLVSDLSIPLAEADVALPPPAQLKHAHKLLVRLQRASIFIFVVITVDLSKDHYLIALHCYLVLLHHHY